MVIFQAGIPGIPGIPGNVNVNNAVLLVFSNNWLLCLKFFKCNNSKTFSLHCIWDKNAPIEFDFLCPLGTSAGSTK